MNGIDLYAYRNSESRQVKLNITYQFGKNKEVYVSKVDEVKRFKWLTMSILIIIVNIFELKKLLLRKKVLSLLQLKLKVNRNECISE